MLNNFLRQEIAGNTVFNYLVCVGILVLALIAIKIFELILLKRLKKFAAKTATTIDDFFVSLIEKMIVPFCYFGAIYFSLQTLAFPRYFSKGINVVGIAVLVVFSVRMMLALISYGFKMYWQKTGRGESSEGSFSGILKVIKFVVWGMAIIFLLDNLGFKISTVIAGLGIGGVAIALAAQAVLKDLFSYFSIIFDRPFEVGDFIIVGDLLGSVEHVGIKTTRIRSLGGEQLVFSNSDLTDSRLRNYKRMEKRRVVFNLGVVYSTPLEKLKLIPEIIKKAVNRVEDATLDRAHFSSYGDFSLIFEIVYYVIGSDYNKYMDIQQNINFSLKEEFENKNIEFAYPTQTLFVSKES